MIFKVPSNLNCSVILSCYTQLTFFGKSIKEKGKFSSETPNAKSSDAVGVRHTEIANYG